MVLVVAVFVGEWPAELVACVVFFVPLFCVLVADCCVSFEGRGSGSWYCGFRFEVDEKDVPIGDPFMLHKFNLTAGGRRKHKGLSSSHCLDVLTALVVLSLLPFSAAPNWLLNDVFVKPIRERLGVLPSRLISVFIEVLQLHYSFATGHCRPAVLCIVSGTSCQSTARNTVQAPMSKLL